MLQKKIVLFDATLPVLIKKEFDKDYAYLYPVNHPDDDVSNQSMARTSHIISISKFGNVYEFIETQNTIYKPE